MPKAEKFVVQASVNNEFWSMYVTRCSDCNVPNGSTRRNDGDEAIKCTPALGVHIPDESPGNVAVTISSH